MATLMGLFKGITFIFYLFFTTYFGSIFIMGPAYPLLFIKQRWFRYYMDKSMNLWLWLPGSLIEWVYGTKVIISGDSVDVKDSPLIIMNHRCLLDWMFYWLGLQRYGRLANTKIIMKDILKLLPGPGWAMQNGMFIFLKRKWEHDEIYLKRLLQYFIDIKYPLQIFLFPEGTNMEDAAQKRSHSFADKNGLVHYNYVLHPRVTGFTYVVQKLRGKIVDTLHDVTVGYKEDRCYTPKDLLFGNFPKEIHLHMKKYKVEDIPTESNELDKWCIDRWAEKERRLKKFFEDGNKFPDKDVSEEAKDESENNYCILLMKLNFAFWTLFLVASFYAVWCCPLVRWYTLIMTVFYGALTFLGNGSDELQLNMHEFSSSTKEK